MNAVLVRIGDYLRAVGNAVRRNPVRTFALLRSLGVAVLAFWPGIVTSDQQTALLLLGAAWLGVDETVVRSQVTPVAAPRLPGGAPVTITNPDPAIPDRTVILPR